ncbi:MULTISPECIES: methyltransferase domain-containing protein [unclassified Pseudonocardia]|uniref:methyltransferase domain-containing protein n=1 Tax=unclassified Pseudonocardia TaxID=2619320 RepID=UPI0001FFE41B|nr:MULTISPECIES: methyltransferase domain-containing protein [unclassified Pseudonocardia]OLM18589.1 Methyltransferase type 11 [Pseudonocardia sp. Ae707_Ps1]
MTVDVSSYFDEGSDRFAGWTSALWDVHGATLVAAAAPRPGERVLDACCGGGSSALPAARAVGPSGRVHGVDLAGGLLATARARATDAGLGNVEFASADVAGWPQGDYDAVLCGFGVFFLPDMDAGTDHLVGLLRDGGRFAMTCWPTGSLEAVFGPFFAAVGRHRPDLLDVPTPQFAANSERLQTEQALRAWLTARGLGGLRIRRSELDIPIDADRGWDFLHSGPVRSVLGGVEQDVVDEIRRSFHDMIIAEGITTLQAPCLVATGTLDRAPER